MILNKWGFVNHTKMYLFPVKKIQKERGPFYENKCQLMYLGPHNAVGFEQMRGLTFDPKLTNFKIYFYLLYKIKIERGLFYETNSQQKNLGPYITSQFGQMEGLPIGPKWTN